MNGQEGVVFDIKEFAVYDGPGIRNTVFLKGCPLSCQWCHNPEGLSPEPQLMVSVAACTHCGRCQAVCPSPAHCILCGRCIPVCRAGLRRIVGQRYTPEALAARLLRDRDVYDMSGGGVTFSGGEPLLQWPFVSETIRLLEGVHTAIETSGCVGDAVFRDALASVDLVMMDWKVSDSEALRHFTGADPEVVLRHLRMLTAGEVPFILRMPTIPGVNDNREHFMRVAELLEDASALVRIEVLPYQRAAGAKYGMVGKQYHPEFDETKDPAVFAGIFDEAHLPYRVMKGF
ncbi:MAG: glycyl-radical enzyme activating protein [Clostridia bacterium]|nr:glycyl-radical enzyme activating protein [Clostridia bacterium]